MQKNYPHIDEALLWQYCSGSLSEEEKLQIGEWVDQSPEHEKQLREVQQLYEASSAETPTFDVDKAWQKVGSHLEASKELSLPQKVKRSRYYSIAMAAAAMIVLFVSIQFLNSYFTEQAKDLTIEVIAKNSTKEIMLPDSSVVTLKPGAQLLYQKNFGSTKRNLSLFGDAYFEVTKNPSLPFRVEGTMATVEVLGTQFYFDQSVIDETQVTVTEGKVSFTPKENKEEKSEEKKKVVLEAGDKGLFNRKMGKLEKTINKDPNFLAWKTGILQFERTKLQEVIKQIEDVYGVTISLSQEQIGNCSLTARFDNQTVDQVFETLSLTFNIQIQKDGKTYRLDGEGC